MHSTAIRAGDAKKVRMNPQHKFRRRFSHTRVELMCLVCVCVCYRQVQSGFGCRANTHIIFI